MSDDTTAMLKEARRIAAEHSVSMREKKRAENRRADGEMAMSSDDEIRQRYMSGLWDSDASVQCALAALQSPVAAVCSSCGGLNTSCPEGCGRDRQTGELDGSTLVATPAAPDQGEVERLRLALATAARRFELLAVGCKPPTVDPKVGAEECLAALRPDTDTGKDATK